MLNTLASPEDRVTTAHRAKLAYIYVRQSTAGQVRQHQESTELQYRLGDRAILFGWPKERVEVIDDDLRQRGASEGRSGRVATAPTGGTCLCPRWPGCSQPRRRGAGSLAVAVCQVWRTSQRQISDALFSTVRLATASAAAARARAARGGVAA